MAEPVFVSAIGFLDKLGVFDVVLPFLLVFTITYAILEKTRVFGVEKINGQDTPRRNLDAMTSFVIAFLVVASSNLVRAVSEVMANMVLLLVLSVSFLLLVGSFYKPEDMEKGVFLEGKWKTLFTIIMFIGVVIIFLHAMQSDNADVCFDQTPCTWLEISWDYLSEYWNSSFVSSIILLIIIGGFIYFVTHDKKGSEE